MKVRHYFPSDDLERAPARSGRIGYRWVPGYAEALPGTQRSMSMTRRDIYAMARRDGYSAKFHPTEDAARAALAAGGDL